MPSEKSARSSLRKRTRNRSIRSATRTYISKAIVAMEGEEGDQSLATVGRAIQALDKAAKGDVIHPNNAARRKSRLMKRFNSLQAGE